MAIRGSIDRVFALTDQTSVDWTYPWLQAANAVVDARLGSAGLSEATLAMIEEHLAAHYFEVGGGQTKTSERLPDYAVTYASKDDLSALRATRNGRIAIELDSSGALAEMSKPRPAFTVM